MSDKMTCMPFPQLLDWVLTERETRGTVFGVRRPYVADPAKAATIFGRPLETPIGPAAGPNSQMAQNIIASYYAGARFFELKTVQKMDGAELAACVNKPCIKADDEGYNCEWSTELYVPEAQDEYIKAWFLLHVMAKEFGLGSADGFQFNISVGYDLEGIRTEKIDTFIESMKEAKNTASFAACREALLEQAGRFRHMTREDIEAIPSAICNSATISTLHGCPPQEIESIANYLLKEKHLHTFIKCNPTLLGYDFARSTMDAMGYDYLVFGRFHFEDDLQYADAIPMFRRLMELSDKLHLEFGVKITNTFPVDVKANELPSEEMYMSGKSLYPLSISLAARLSRELDGKLRIAYSGGADAFNIGQIIGCGVWPVTVATTILKDGGYQRFSQMAESLEKKGVSAFTGIDVPAIERLASYAVTDPHHMKSAKMPPVRKSKEAVPLLNCFTAPCEDTCPIHQDVSTYMMLSGEKRYEEAMDVIMDKNPLPFITGTICAHTCMTRCTRNFYESPVQIRQTKLLCASIAYDKALEKCAPKGSCGKKVAVVGGGPAGMASAFYLARAGAKVTIFEKESRLGGIVEWVIPNFRIDEKTVQKDVSFLKKLGVEIRTGEKIEQVSLLKEQGFDAVILAVGAYRRGKLTLPGCEVRNALEFLEEFNQKEGAVELGSHVVVIGGGNTAMDTARAAKQTKGVSHVSLVYRRTKRYMPADEEELLLAIEDGVEFCELLSPVRVENGQLICRKMTLGDVDASGRRGVVETDEEISVAADTVIAAVGEKVPTDFYEKNGLTVDEKGRPRVDDGTFASSAEQVYIVGDGRFGPATVVEGIRDAKKAVEAIVGGSVSTDQFIAADQNGIREKKGILAEAGSEGGESRRCLSCSTVCENCVDVCPNRANLSIRVPGMEVAQIVHVDYLCNECGNCNTFCPYASAPYKDKFTLFANESDMQDSKNDGFTVVNAQAKTYKVRFLGKECVCEGKGGSVPDALVELMDAVVDGYAYVVPGNG